MDAWIYDAVRTPRGKGKAPKAERPGGALHALGPQALITQLIDALTERLGPTLVPHVERLLLGCVGQLRSQGGHLALVCKLASSLPARVHAKTLNNYCVSGLSAVNESALWAAAGQPGLSLAGGVEMLSQVPFLADSASYYTVPELASKLRWMLPVMGAELMANLEGFSKPDLDALSLRSHSRASVARRAVPRFRGADART